jgi:CDP-diglyceride synthetase
MSAAGKYALSGAAIVGVSTAALWPWLDPAARSGVLIAGLVALPLQVAAFALLLRYRGELTGFLAVWAGGTLFRMVVVSVVATLAIRSRAEGAVPMLLALVGFFFGLLLLEPVYFRPGVARRPEAR